MHEIHVIAQEKMVNMKPFGVWGDTFFQILHCSEDDLVPEENADQLHEVATIEREKDSRKR